MFLVAPAKRLGRAATQRCFRGVTTDREDSYAWSLTFESSREIQCRRDRFNAHKQMLTAKVIHALDITCNEGSAS